MDPTKVKEIAEGVVKPTSELVGKLEQKVIKIESVCPQIKKSQPKDVVSNPTDNNCTLESISDKLDKIIKDRKSDRTYLETIGNFVVEHYNEHISFSEAIKIIGELKNFYKDIEGIRTSIKGLQKDTEIIKKKLGI